jgi:hypothetical protein
MITNEPGYRQTLEWLERFQKTLEKDKKKYLPHNPQMYKIVSGGTISQIEELKKEVAEYEQKLTQVTV